MQEFFRAVDTFIDTIADMFIYLTEFFTVGIRAGDFVFELFNYLPSYFYIGIAPFIALFVILLFADRG